MGNNGDEKGQLNHIVEELGEIKKLLKRMVNLFEQYDTDALEVDEVQRDFQGTRKNGWRG